MMSNRSEKLTIVLTNMTLCSGYTHHSLGIPTVPDRVVHSQLQYRAPAGYMYGELAITRRISLVAVSALAPR
jgi:hypothetical protein